MSDIEFSLEKKFMKGVCGLLKKVKKDSGFSHPFVYLIFEGNYLTIARFNRTACIFVACHKLQISCALPSDFQYIGKMSVVDFLDIVKSATSDIIFKISFDDHKLEINSGGGIYNYIFKDLDGDESAGWKFDGEATSLFSLYGGVVQTLADSLLVTPVGRTPSCLDSIVFDGKVAYSTDIGVMSSLDIFDLVVPSDWLGGKATKESVTSHLRFECKIDKPIPSFLFDVCQDAPEMCQIEFEERKDSFSASFEIPEYCIIKVLHKPLEGIFPMDVTKKSRESIQDVPFGRFDNTKMQAALKKIKAISKNDNIVNIRANGENLFFNVKFDEKSAESFVKCTDSNDLFSEEDDGDFLEHMDEKYRAVANDILLALKPIGEVVQFSIHNNFLVLKDLWRTYILPVQ